MDGSRRKIYRQKTFQWLSVVENILHTLSGRGLMQFLPRVPLCPRRWPYLCISADQGSDALAGSYYLKYHLGLNVD